METLVINTGVIEDQEFHNLDIYIDDNVSYNRCKFSECRLILRDNSMPNLTKCIFVDWYDMKALSDYMRDIQEVGTCWRTEGAAFKFEYGQDHSCVVDNTFIRKTTLS